MHVVVRFDDHVGGFLGIRDLSSGLNIPNG